MPSFNLICHEYHGADVLRTLIFGIIGVGNCAVVHIARYELGRCIDPGSEAGERVVSGKETLTLRRAISCWSRRAGAAATAPAPSGRSSGEPWDYLITVCGSAA